MLTSLFGRRSTSKKKASLAKRIPRLELLESRLALSGLPWWQVVPKSVAASAGPTVTLSTTADASVSAVNPFTNYGTTTDLLVRNDSNSFTIDDAEAYLRFNTSSLSGTIAKAVLTLTPLSLGQSAASLTLGVQLLQAGDDGWIEGIGGTNRTAAGPTTWYNSPSGTGQIATLAGSQLAVGMPISIDVTLLINQGISTSGVASFVIGAVSWSGRNQIVDFASREYGHAAYRPTLLITLASPVVPPTPIGQPTTGSSQTNTQATVFYGIKDPTLSSLTQSLDADGSISRTDMIQILRAAETLNGGVVSQGVLTDLKTLLADAAVLNMPGYVQVLAGDIINGNTANTSYQGQTLGNLAVNSSGTHLDKLISKWFLGADHPSTGGYSYSTVTGPLFSSSGPSHLDEHQGYLGDCYLISSLGTIADTAPAAIQNMIIDNGVDAKTGVHTWTVRFYNNGKADYVTVDDKLPASGGGLVFDGAGYGTNSPPGLWIALIEKAYAQWNETGKEGRNGTNTYAGIEGGWMADVDAQVLGHGASSYNLYSSSDLQALISGTTNKQAVTIGTQGQNSLPYGLYGGHAYAVTGYNPSTRTFTLYNPWGVYQPTQSLTWAQLQATCAGFVVANAAGTQAFATSQVLSPRPTALEPKPPLAIFSVTTNDFTADEGETGEGTLARQELDSSSPGDMPIRQAAVNGSIDSALKALDKIHFAVSNAMAARHGGISAHLQALAVDRVFEAT